MAEVDLLLHNVLVFGEADPKNQDREATINLTTNIVSLKQKLSDAVLEQANAISILSEYENIVSCLNAWMEQTENELDRMEKNEEPEEQKLSLIMSERDTFQSSLDRSTELFHALLACTNLSDEMDQRRFHAALEHQWEKISKTLNNRLKKKKKKQVVIDDLGTILAQAKGNLSEMGNILAEPIQIASDEQLIVEKRKHMFLKDTLNNIDAELQKCSNFKKIPMEYGEALGQFKFSLKSYQEQVILRITEIEILIQAMRKVNTEIRTIESVVDIAQKKIEALRKLTNGDKINQVVPVLKVILSNHKCSKEVSFLIS